MKTGGWFANQLHPQLKKDQKRRNTRTRDFFKPASPLKRNLKKNIKAGFWILYIVQLFFLNEMFLGLFQIY